MKIEKRETKKKENGNLTVGVLDTSGISSTEALLGRYESKRYKWNIVMKNPRKQL